MVPATWVGFNQLKLLTFRGNFTTLSYSGSFRPYRVNVHFLSLLLFVTVR
jgi:hypothetical protein